MGSGFGNECGWDLCRVCCGDEFGFVIDGSMIRTLDRKTKWGKVFNCGGDEMESVDVWGAGIGGGIRDKIISICGSTAPAIVVVLC